MMLERERRQTTIEMATFRGFGFQLNEFVSFDRFIVQLMLKIAQKWKALNKAMSKIKMWRLLLVCRVCVRKWRA